MAKEFVEVTLTNPGFEKTLEGWKIVQAAGLVRTMTDAAHSGKRGLRVADDSAERNTIVSCAFPFVPGDAYECRFWARVVSARA
ncbi:MAG: carbohydrate binding domain-containing protein [Rhodopseudomonas palustris]|nr:carbohydrate binding domain-containing protein [Rhodopseudomonas palustris]